MGCFRASRWAWVLVLALSGAGLAAAQAQSMPESVERGLALLRSGDLAAAEAVFRDIVQQDPQHGTAHMQLGRIALERGEWEVARKHLEIATVSSPQRPSLAWFLLGRVQLLLRQPNSSVESFSRSLQRTPRFAPALLGRARALLLLREVEAALQDLERARNLSAPSQDSTLLAAQALIYLDRLDEARGYLQGLVDQSAAAGSEEQTAARMLLQALSGAKDEQEALMVALGQHFDLADGYVALGILHLRAGRKNASVPPLRIALEMEPENPMPELFLEKALGELEPAWLPEPYPRLEKDVAAALRHLEAGNAAEARRISAEILARHPFFVPARLLLIRDAEQREDRWQALAGYRQLLEWLPGLPVLEARMAQLALAMEAYELAECGARRAIAVFPQDGSLRYLLASALAGTGQTDAAIELCHAAISLGFQESRVYVTLGDLYFEKLQISDSIAAYARALELDPGAAEIMSSFAVSSLTTEQFSALKTLLERHLASHPENVNTLYSLGVMSLRDNELEQAEAYFLRLRQVAPRHLQVHYNLGQIYLRQGRQEEGRAAMNRFREIKAREDEAWLKHNQAHARRLEAQDAVAEGDLETAIAIYTEILAEGTGNLEDTIAVGRACLGVGDYLTAYEWYERVLESSPYLAEALEGVEQAAEALNRTEVAQTTRLRLELLQCPGE